MKIAYWLAVAAIIVAQVLGYISLSIWVLVALVALPFVVWFAVVAFTLLAFAVWR